MAAAGSAVWIDVLPTVNQLGPRMVSAATSAARQAGTAAGRQFSSSLSAGAAGGGGATALVRELEQATQKATRTIAKERAAIFEARNAEKAAAQGVQAAEAKLAQARLQNQASASKVAQSEAALAAARLKHGAESAQAATAEQALLRAQASAQSTLAASIRAEQALTTSRGRLTAAGNGVAIAEERIRVAYRESATVAGQLTAAQAAAARQTAVTTGALARQAAIGAPLAGTLARVGSGLGGIAKDAYATVAPLAQMAAGFGAIVGIAKVISLGNQYTKTMNELGAVTNATAAEMANASRVSRELGSDLTLPATSGADAAAIMVELAKGGLSLQGAMDAAKGTIQLAAAAQIDGAQAAEIQANSLNQFGLAADQAGLVADVLANTANAAAGGVEDIGTSMKYVGPVAKSLGINIQDTASAIGLLANQGLKGDTAGTALRGVLAALAAPSAQASEALKKLNIQAFDQQGKFVGLRSVIDQLTVAQGKMTQEQFASNAATAFGREPLAAITALASEGAKGFDAMSVAVTRQGGAAEVAQSQMKGLGGAMDKLESQLEDIALSIYDTVSPALETAVNGIAGYLDGAGDKVSTFLDLVGGLGKLAVTGQVSGNLTATTNWVPDSPEVQGILAGRDLVVAAFRDIQAFVGESLVPSLQNAAVAVTPLATILAGVFLGALRAVAWILQNVIGPALVATTGFLREHQGVVIVAAAAIGYLVLAYKAQQANLAILEAGGLAAYIRQTKAGVFWTNAKAAALTTVKGAMLVWNGLLKTGAALQFTYVAATKGWTYALMLQRGAQVAATTTTGTLTAAQWAYNAALSANPIGLVIIAIVAIIAAIAALVAGVIWAYNNLGWFKTAVDAVWTGIQVGAKAVADAAVWLWQTILVPAWQGIAAAATWAWENVLKPAFDGIMTAVRFVGAVFTWWWQNIVTPVFQGVAAVAGWFWNTFSAIAELIVAMVRATVGPIFSWLYEAIVKPVFEGIVTAVQTSWSVASIIFGAIVSFVRDTLGVAFAWLYTAIVKPVFDWIVQSVQLGWLGMKVVFDAISNFLRATLGPVFTWLYETIIKPVWDGIKTAISVVWDFLKPIFDKIADVAKVTIPAAFAIMKDGIAKAWEAVKDAVKAPITFVVDTVINKALIGNFNKVADAFGTKHIDPIPWPPKGFARGGVLDGYQSAKRDEVLTPMRKGEGVLVPEVVRALGPGFVHSLNAAGNTGGVSAVRSLAGYAKGGVVGSDSGADGGNSGGLLDGIVNWAQGAASNVLDVLTDPMGTLGKFVKGVIDKVPGAGRMVDMAAGVGRKLLDAAISKLSSLGLMPSGGNGANGQIPAGALAKVSGFTGGSGVGPLGGYLKVPAARAWEMAYRASGGAITLTEGYRSLQDQQMRFAAYRAGRGNLAATPGTSIHGFGLAADVGAGQAWMRANGPRFGWQPTGLSFAQREPWHFEYKGGAGQPAGGMALGGVMGLDATLMDRGGVLPTGPSLVVNKLNQPEYALPEDRLIDVVAQASDRNGGDVPLFRDLVVQGGDTNDKQVRGFTRAARAIKRGGPV